VRGSPAGHRWSAEHAWTPSAAAERKPCPQPCPEFSNFDLAELH
jgi:hypothetical protein